MTTETTSPPGAAHDILLAQAQEALAFERARADRAEAALEAERERAEAARAEAASLRALLGPGPGMTPAAAAAALGITAAALCRLEEQGRLMAGRSPGGHRRYAEADVRALQEELGTWTGMLLTAGQVAVMFRVDPKTVGRWASAGKLTRDPAGRRGYRESEVLALLRGAPEGGKA